MNALLQGVTWAALGVGLAVVAWFLLSRGD
jgi:hypothetical protein